MGSTVSNSMFVGDHDKGYRSAAIKGKRDSSERWDHSPPHHRAFHQFTCYDMVVTPEACENVTKGAAGKQRMLSI